MRRLALPLLFALGLLAAGGLSATVVAATGTGTTSTSTDTTSTTTTGTTTTGTTTTGPSPTTIAPGVTVGGVPVGGMSGAAAKTAVLSVVNQPIVVKVVKHTFRSSPSGVGAVPQIKAAIKRALEASPNTDLALAIAVKLRLTRTYVAK